MLAWDWVRRVSKQPSWQLSFVLIGFLLGVAVHSWVQQPLPVLPLVIIGCGLILCGVVFLTSEKKNIGLVVIVGAMVLFGLVRYALSFPLDGGTSIAAFAGSTVRIEGTVVNDPDTASDQQEVILDELTVNGQSADNKLIVWLQRYPSVSYDWRISFRCKLDRPEAIDGFAYDRFLLRLGIVATCFPHDEPLIVSVQTTHPMRFALFDLRHTIQRLLARAIPEPEESIASGLLLGTKTLPDALDQAFRKVGVSHIFAASGSNVAMVLVVCLGALAYVVKRDRTLWILLSIIIVYVILAGAEAAVVRAGIMAATVLVATHSGRATSPRNLILLAATVMLIVNPRLLRDDVGFQLSMLATIGMATLSPILQKKLAFMPKALGLREALSTTLSATAFTLPIMILNFHQFALVSPIANLLILPFVPYAMAFSALAAALTLIHPALGVAVGGIAWAFEKVIIVIAIALAAL